MSFTDLDQQREILNRFSLPKSMKHSVVMRERVCVCAFRDRERVCVCVCGFVRLRDREIVKTHGTF